MKKILPMTLAAGLIICSAVTSCRGSGDKTIATTEVNEEMADPVEMAISRYLTDSIGPQYLQAEVCVPVTDIVDTCRTAQGDTLLAWGLFRVFNFNIQGDTLHLVSGGNHPGMMRLCNSDDGSMTVVAFDQVGDGSSYMPDVRRIFGDKADALHAVTSNDKRGDSLLVQTVADYVRAHRLSATMMKEYGREPVSLY